MIVDDDPYNLMALKILLTKVDSMFMKEISENTEIKSNLIKIIDAKSGGQEAVQAVVDGYCKHNIRYNLILMDCSMPIVDGYEATEQIRKFLRNHNLQQPQIVACTGHVEPEFIKKAWCYEMDEVISKPASVQQLFSLMQEILVYK